MRLKDYLLFVGLFAFATVAANGEECGDYCLPGMKCWPSIETWYNYMKFVGLGVEILSPYNTSTTRFVDACVMKNTYESRVPFAIVLVETAVHVQKWLAFAKQNNIRVTVRSSGHDFLGRSTADSSLQLDVVKMKDISIDLRPRRNQAGVVKVGAGCIWKEVYQEIDKVNRVIVGGSSPYVSVSGYTMGGGHSPITRMFGLAVDNLLEAEVITPDGHIITANENSNSDLFWALRGGGGGTFGVVTSLTFKLHYAPEGGFVQLVRTFPMISSDGTNVARDVLAYYTDLLPNLPEEWGGYILSGSGPVAKGTTQGYVTFALLHAGNWSMPSRAYLDKFATYHSGQGSLQWINFTSFWDYEQHVNDGAVPIRETLFGGFVQLDKVGGFANKIADSMHTNPNNVSFVGCTLIHIGGASNRTAPDVTSVHPSFRSASWSAGCGVIWDDPSYDSLCANTAKQFDSDVSQYTDGVYLNEACAYQANWKDSFWGGKYDRLLSIKQKYDKTNFLTCKYCVGSDLPRNYHTTTTTPTNTQPIVG